MTYESHTLCMSHSPGFARDVDEEYGDAFRGGLAEVRDLVQAWQPTLVVFFGSDHRRAFTDIVPSISTVYSAEGLGDSESPTGPYDVPTDTAKALTEYLLNENFDVAITRHIALDHGFGQTAADVLGSLDATPIVPIFVNCATPPLSQPKRSADLGRAVGAFFEKTNERVLYIASGGMSHNPPTLALTDEGLSEAERKKISAAHREAAMDDIRPEWDQRVLAQLSQSDNSWVDAITNEDIAVGGVGAHELRTWYAAYAAGKKPLRTVAYEPVRMWLTGMGIATSLEYELGS